MNPVTRFLFKPSTVDFLERVGATGFESGASAYFVGVQNQETLKLAVGAAVLSMVKFLYLKLGTWQGSKVLVNLTNQTPSS